MNFTVTQLGIVHAAATGTSSPQNIARALNKSISQIYRAIDGLERNHILKLNRKEVQFTQHTHSSMLADLLVEHPHLTNLLSDSAITILLAFMQPASIDEIAQYTGLNKAGIYRWIKRFRKASIVRKQKHQYYINEALWPELKEFLLAFRRFHEHIDQRVPPRVMIHHKDTRKVVFSSKAEEDGSLTAFSRFTDFGIHILTTRNYYRLPQRELNERDVFLDSLLVAEKEKEPRNLLFIALFYLKHKQELRGIHHPVLTNIKEVLKGKHITGYPTLADIRERAEMYGVSV